MKKRYSVIFSLFLILLFGIWGRLFYWQVVRAQELADLGQSQSAVNLEIPPKRGSILASDGFPLVTNKISYLLYANPKVVTNKNVIANILGETLHVDSASISAQLDLDRVWVPLATNLSQDKKELVTNLHIDGLGFQENPVRFYPEASLSAQLLGFVGKDNVGSDKGYFGIEGFYDRQLRGRVGKTTMIRDAFGHPIFAKLVENSGQEDGRALKLTVDRTIQFLAERELQKAVENYGAKSGMVGVMDPKTGAILAMASFPNFDPQTFWKFSSDVYKNPFITDTYEPGSTLKPLVMASAIDDGLVTPQTTCNICDKPVQVGDYDIHTWNNEYIPNISMTDVIIHSDNTGMVFVSKKMGLDRMLDMLHSFGIDQETGIDLQGETAPILKQKNDWYPIDVATASFGQGLSVTPIQLLSAFSSIANNGARMQPYIVSEIETPDGQRIPIEPKTLGKTVSSSTAKVMTEILVSAVEKGEANFARLKNYRIAGKTGTASIPVAGHYDPTKTIASFIGYAPAENPKFIMLVIINQPTTSIYGAETAAPTFFNIAQGILMHLGVTPNQ